VLGHKPRPKDFYGTTLREAVEKRNAWKPSRALPGGHTPFLEYLETDFDRMQEASYNADELSWQRLCNRRSRIRRFILDPEDRDLQAARIRRVVMQDLTPDVVEEFFETLKLAGVSAANRNGLIYDLRLALRQAKRRIPSPVADYFEEVRIVKEQRKPKRLFLEADIFAAISDPSKPLEARLLAGFILITQCRPSEQFALQWQDVDLANKTVRIEKAVRFTHKGFKVKVGTKTGEKGERTLPLGEALFNMLRELRKERMASGSIEDHVFLWRGKPLNKDRCRYAWDEAREQLGLPEGPTFYSLKTLGNSYLARRGTSAEVRAKRMGHTTTRMATQTYRDIIDAEIVTSSKAFDSAFRTARTSRVKGTRKGTGRKNAGK
jgi:integrase